MRAIGGAFPFPAKAEYADRRETEFGEERTNN